jgi:hypothetical protein
MKKVNSINSSIENKMNENLLGVYIFINIKGAKFRILNEKLYTTTSAEAFDYFNNNPEDFDIVTISVNNIVS